MGPASLEALESLDSEAFFLSVPSCPSLFSPHLLIVITTYLKHLSSPPCPTLTSCQVFLLGLALLYAQLDPVPVEVKPGAEGVFEKKAGPPHSDSEAEPVRRPNRLFSSFTSADVRGNAARGDSTIPSLDGLSIPIL